MNINQLAENIFREVQGKSNVESVTHCMTRLRIVLKNENLVDDEIVESLSGVIGVVRQGGQYQIIIGNKVEAVFNEFERLMQDSSNHEDVSEQVLIEKKEQNIVSRVFGFISSCMTPVLPAIVAGGMVKVLLTILTTFNIVGADTSTYQIFSILGDAPFYFLPFALAYSTAKKVNVNPVLAIAIVGVLLHPSLSQLYVDEQIVTLFGLPVTETTYSASVIPVLMIVLSMKYITQFAEKVSPDLIKVFFKPLLILLISAPLALIIIGPIGGIVGDLLAKVIEIIFFQVGWLGLAVTSALFPLLVMTGMHYAIIPVGLNVLAKTGMDVLAMVFFCSNIAQGGASLAVALFSKDSKMRQTASAAGITAVLAGVTEPALYGVNLKLKKPLIAACIGGGLSGMFAGLVGLYAYTAVGSSGVFTLLSMISEDGFSMIIKGIATLSISFLSSFTLTAIMIKKNDKRDIRDNLQKNAESIHKKIA